MSRNRLLLFVEVNFDKNSIDFYNIVVLSINDIQSKEYSRQKVLDNELLMVKRNMKLASVYFSNA